MNKAEKALAACKEYDRLMTEIRKNTKTIGDGLDHCTRMAPVPSAPFLKELPEGVKSHVQEVFAGYVGGDWEPEHRHYTEAKAMEMVKDCPGCLRAYKAVQERKANKKKLGAIKRTIRAIGRSA